MSLSMNDLKGIINNKNINFSMLFIVCVFLIFIYSSYIRDNKDFKDVLQTKLGLFDLDGWSVSHLLFFMLIGYNYGDKYLVAAFILGVIWEIFEQLYGGKLSRWWFDSRPLERKWWYGKHSDIIINTSGLLIGYYLKNKSFPFLK
jgi:hypothetical protein